MSAAKTVITSVVACMVIQCLAAQPKVVVTSSGGRDYYHIAFSLTPANCELSVPVSERKSYHGGSNEYHFAEGGQFEVFVRKEAFPVEAPACEGSFLILRMPWTNPAHPQAEEFTAVKRDLFDRIGRMKAAGEGSVDVFIELNPYVHIVQENPLKVELTGRNIFFRQAHYQYIGYTGPLNPEQ